MSTETITLIDAWCTRCKRQFVVTRRAGELFARMACPHCGGRPLMGRGAKQAVIYTRPVEAKT